MAQYIKTEDGYKEFSIVTDNKMDKTNPTGTGSFSMNRKASTVIGTNSHAEGDDTTASGAYSHAEGSSTQASGIVSHAEGFWTKASGDYSHAEGYWTTASGAYSHAEGNNTTARGIYSHAEGSGTNKFSSVVTTTNPTTVDIINVWKNKKFSVAEDDYSHVEGRDNLALSDCSHAEGYQTIASGPYSHAEGNQTTASHSHSHAEGIKTTASGISSHAEGGSTTASGDFSHAEGGGTTASGYMSHAEGYNTTASGYYSHAEGDGTTASGVTTHAEGSRTRTSGESSHAEGGGTEATGDYSHAEGYNTTASGYYSHAEGANTTASGEGSHAQGKYNIEDTSNKYADIIGNGTNNTARSNAATVDWEGNAWFAGDVYTGSTSGTNKDEGSKKLATEEYVNSSIAAGRSDISLGLTSAAVGQTIKVKAIDESGKPTEWEAAEMAGGEPSFPKFEKLLTYTITDDDIAANPAAYIWNTTQIPNLNDYNVFTLTMRSPDGTTKIVLTKWVAIQINNARMGSLCGTSTGARQSYSISANRLYGHWVSDSAYNPTTSTGTTLTPPHSNTSWDTTLAASEAVTKIGFTSYGGDYGLTAGIIVEIWGAK